MYYVIIVRIYTNGWTVWAEDFASESLELCQERCRVIAYLLTQADAISNPMPSFETKETFAQVIDGLQMTGLIKLKNKQPLLNN